MGRFITITDLDKRIELYWSDFELGLEVTTRDCHIKVYYEKTTLHKTGLIEVERWGLNESRKIIISYFGEKAERIETGLNKVIEKWGLSS